MSYNYTLLFCEQSVSVKFSRVARGRLLEVHAWTTSQIYVLHYQALLQPTFMASCLHYCWGFTDKATTIGMFEEHTTKCGHSQMWNMHSA